MGGPFLLHLTADRKGVTTWGDREGIYKMLTALKYARLTRFYLDIVSGHYKEPKTRHAALF